MQNDDIEREYAIFYLSVVAFVGLLERIAQNQEVDADSFKKASDLFKRSLLFAGQRYGVAPNIRIPERNKN